MFACLFLICVFLSIGIIWGGAQWVLGESPPSLRAGRGGAGRVWCAGLRPAVGLSDCASKGERCDTYGCKGGPSERGPAEDLCSGTWALSGGAFPSVFPDFARTCPEYGLLPLHSHDPSGDHLVPEGMLGVLLHTSLSLPFSLVGESAASALRFGPPTHPAQGHPGPGKETARPQMPVWPHHPPHPPFFVCCFSQTPLLSHFFFLNKNFPHFLGP